MMRVGSYHSTVISRAGVMLNTVLHSILIKYSCIYYMPLIIKIINYYAGSLYRWVQLPYGI